MRVLTPAIVETGPLVIIAYFLEPLYYCATIAVMFFLSVDVRHCVLQLAGTEGENAISALPCKFGLVVCSFIGPVAARSFEVTHHVSNRQFGGNRQDEMEVILGPIDGVQYCFEGDGLACYVVDERAFQVR